MFVDSHCHLDQVEGLEVLLSRAREAGVERIVSCATSPASVQAHLSRFKGSGQVCLALGLHPEELLLLDLTEAQAAFRNIEANLSLATAVGEVGLDYKYAAL